MNQARRRVLIVDDDVFFLEAIDEILTDVGFEIVRAEDGESALEKVADVSIGAVVLDVRLPDMDGIQVLAGIRESRPGLPVIMLSASTDQEIVLEALRLGASDYLGKPLHDEELTLAVGRALEGFEANSEGRRLRQRLDRLVEGMERLSQLVRLAAPEERVDVLRQGIVDSASVVLRTSRASLMLADSDREWLSVVASRGVDVAGETMTARKVGEGASGSCFAEGKVLCVPDVENDSRFSGRGPGNYESSGFAVVPLVCLGVPVGVLCLTEADESELSLEETNILRLLGMQISEFLAADPEVERLLASANVADSEGTMGFDLVEPIDGDAELARTVCEAVAAEANPERVMRSALGAVAQRLGAAPVSLYMQSSDAGCLDLEAEVDGGVVGDRAQLPPDRGLVGGVAQTGQLVAAESPQDDPRFESAVDTASDGVIRPMICVPIRLREKSVGVLRVFMEEGGRASPRTAEILGAAFSAAVRNVLLYRSLLQSIEEVAEARRLARS
ncbi:MAG: response regulator [bacterium]|nr:hypothetical protein [Deltaproteobacteria bacterium]MCP4905538.1 response regulator [bacterium]